MEQVTSLVQIKGIRDGLLATFVEAAWEDQCIALLAQIDDRPLFFQGARLAMDVGSQVLKVNDLVGLRDQLSERNVNLWAVISELPVTEQTSQLLGLATRISKPRRKNKNMQILLQRILPYTSTRLFVRGSALNFQGMLWSWAM